MTVTEYDLATRRGRHLVQTPASPLATRLELLRNTLRPTPHVQLAMKRMDLFAKLEYVNPVGSIKDRAAYWILKRAAERGRSAKRRRSSSPPPGTSPPPSRPSLIWSACGSSR